MTQVLVGLSGGVDSAVSALLLQNNGFKVFGANLLLTENASADSSACLKAIEAAQKLNIPLYVKDFKNEFNEKVIRYFVSEYMRGNTPNPCVRCNPEVKFASLIALADQYGIPYVATGHYARIIKDHEDGFYYLYASPSKKDQSYFLYRLNQEQLKRIQFPLGDFQSKDEIRAFAQKAGFSAAADKDSQEICFIPDNDYINFITKHTAVSARPGAFLDINGNVIGTHSGITHYTVGQRKGLGAFGTPKYVRSINAGNNTVTLCNANERFTDSITADNLLWTSGQFPDDKKPYLVKVRSTAAPALAELIPDQDKMRVRFLSPVLAPAPGQSAVVYDGDKVLGGGIVVSSN